MEPEIEGDVAVAEALTEKRCQGTKLDGHPCGVEPSLLIEDEANPGTYWCFNHHPDYEEARQHGRSKGGLRAMARMQRFKFLDRDELGELRTLQDAQRWAALIATATATGRLSSAAGGVVLKALEAFLRSVEAVDLEARLAEVEQRLRGGAR